MFIKKDAKKVIDMMANSLPQELVDDPDIIIAGGFALNLYMVNELLEAAESSSAQGVMKKHFENFPLIKFSDVDLWILKDSQSIHAPLFKAISDAEAIKKVQDAGGVTPNNRATRAHNALDHLMRRAQFSTNPFQFGPIKPTIAQNENIVRSGKGRSFFGTKSSVWANTYEFAGGVVNGFERKSVQCVVKEQDSVESLLSEFDLSLSSVAIHRGEFIIHKSLVESLDKKEILYNKRTWFTRRSFASRLFLCLRYMKYVDKIGFDLSSDLYKDVLSTISDASSFWNEAKKLGMGNDLKIKVTTNSNYEQEIVTRESIYAMAKKLAAEFPKLAKMKHYDVSHVFFIADSEIFKIKDILEPRVVEVRSNQIPLPAPIAIPNSMPKINISQFSNVPPLPVQPIFYTKDPFDELFADLEEVRS